MKLATTTLGCMKWDLPTALARVKAYGFDGIDLRGLRGQLAIHRLPEFGPDLADSAARIRDSGLEVSGLSTGIRLTDTAPEAMAAFDEELSRCAEVCAAVGCRHMRVFGGDLKAAGGAQEQDRARVADLVAARVAALADRARSIAAVDLLIETHDAWTHSAHMAGVLERVGRDDVACCWDVKHTYWHANEAPQVTWRRLAPWVRNTHWKDGRRHAGHRPNGLLCLLGEGILPLADIYDCLASSGYDGWYTLEWEKHWHPHIEEPEVAFPHFVRFMRELDARWQREHPAAG